jgi:hypothetical protein
MGPSLYPKRSTVNSIEVNDHLWHQLVNIAEVADLAPEIVAISILHDGVEAKIAVMREEAEAEAFRLEAQLTEARARLAGLNGSSKAPRSPVEPLYSAPGRVTQVMTLDEAVRAVLDSDRQRTWKTDEVLDQVLAMGFDLPDLPRRNYGRVNGALRRLCTLGLARNPVRGQYTWRRRPNNPRS